MRRGGKPVQTEKADPSDARYRETLVQMLRSQAYRELAAARLFGHGLQFAPTAKDVKFMAWHIQEETEHYLDVAKLYEKFVGESVDPWVQERLAQKPIPMASSWLELGIAQWLYDRGGFWQLQEYLECSWPPYRTIVGKIVKEERGHQDHGQRIAVELCQSAANRAEAQGLFARWLRQGLLSFGRPGSDGDRYAVRVGLKRRDASAVVKDFMTDIKPAIRAAGLTLPTKESLDMELPADLDWTL
jgi:1,2-phenylacetyl-CoA epoxidase catalytic subunit